MIGGKRLVSSFSAHHKCMVLLLLLIMVVIIYIYSHLGSGIKSVPLHVQRQDDVKSAAPVSIPKQHLDGIKNAGPLTIWRPKDHGRSNFSVGKLKVSSEAVNSRKEAKSVLTVYLYPPPDWICDEVRKIGAWEPHIITPLIKYFLKNPELNLIDIGTMIGVYTLHVANIGRQVVGVDGSKENLLRLGQSLIDNKLEDQVILVHNIIDAKYGRRVLNTIKSHVGAAYIGTARKETYQNPPVEAILADDLLRVIPFKRAVLKVDIELFEYQMLQKASKLFDAIDIPLILMEYNPVARTRKSRNFIRNFMTSRDMFPYATIESTSMLGPDDMKWPFDIVWRKNKALSDVH